MSHPNSLYNKLSQFQLTPVRKHQMKKIIALLLFTAGVSPSLQATTYPVNNVTALKTAISNAVAGDVIVVDGGEYLFTARLDIKNKNGTAAKNIQLIANPSSATRPRFNFSAQAEASANQGILLENCSYWLIKGIDVYKAGDNGMQIKNSSNNIVEFCTFSECSDTGLQLDNGSANNLILNCDSYYNADSSLENADGFASKLNVGSGNTFKGCRAWQNLDDGWDGYLKETDNVNTFYENCWAFNNGKLKTGATSGGDGNGFKSGGSDGKDLKHNASYKNCIAAGNVKKGFDHNSNRGEVTLLNCAAYANTQSNMGFGNTNPLAKLTIKNTLVLGATGDTNAGTKDISNNSWNSTPAITVSNADFGSVDISELGQPRKADGSLPDVNFLRPKAGSALIDRGVNVGLTYYGTAPDIGAFEYNPALPLNLLSFTLSSPNQNAVKLTWLTANEVNTGKFEIYRRQESGSFKLIYTVAAANKTGIQEYSFTDYNYENGTSYYLLKQIDLDGTVTLTETRAIKLGLNRGQQLLLYPNPAQNFIAIDFGTYAIRELQIFDTEGRLLSNDISKDQLFQKDVSALPSGLYILKIKTEATTSQHRFVKE